jgi:hypothetical protein
VSPQRLGIAGLGVTGRACVAAAQRHGHEVHVLAYPGSRTPQGARAHTSLDGLFAGADTMICALPARRHVDFARRALAYGRHVVSVGDSIEDVVALRRLHAEATERDRLVVIGAGFSPGVSCVLAGRGAAQLDVVDEIHVAKVGTGGPACARQHHRALGEVGIDWRDGRWQRRPAGSGRELMWFPDPVGGADCYRAALPDALLLQPTFPQAGRITARMAATRRDRMTARLPMLAPPHAEGGMGAIRVELRGRRAGAREVIVLGVAAHPGPAAAAMALAVAELITAAQGVMAGVQSVAELGQTAQLLALLKQLDVEPLAFAGADS